MSDTGGEAGGRAAKPEGIVDSPLLDILALHHLLCSGRHVCSGILCDVVWKRRQS